MTPVLRLIPNWRHASTIERSPCCLAAKNVDPLVHRVGLDPGHRRTGPEAARVVTFECHPCARS